MVTSACLGLVAIGVARGCGRNSALGSAGLRAAKAGCWLIRFGFAQVCTEMHSKTVRDHLPTKNRKNRVMPD